MGSTSKELGSDDSLECSVCLEQYVNPKMLTCMHTFCQRCLEPLLKGGEISCPNCRYVTKVKGDVTTLSTNWIFEGKIAAYKWKESVKEGLLCCSECEETADQFCTDCKLLFCKLCSAHHKRVTRSKNHVIIDDVDKLNLSEVKNYASHRCKKHNEVRKYFCLSCQVNLCYDCTLGSLHRGHEIVLHNDIMQEKMEDLKSLVETGNIFINKWMKRLENRMPFIRDAYKVKETSVKNVEECFDVIIDSLLKSKQKLVNWLETGFQESTKSIEDEIKELNVLTNSLQYGSKLFKIQKQNGNHLNLLQAVSNCASQIDDILAINDISSTDKRKIVPYVTKREIQKVDVTRKFDDIFKQIFSTKDCDTETSTISRKIVSSSSKVTLYKKNGSVKVNYESPLRCKQTKYQFQESQ